MGAFQEKMKMNVAGELKNLNLIAEKAASGATLAKDSSDAF